MSHGRNISGAVALGLLMLGACGGSDGPGTPGPATDGAVVRTDGPTVASDAKATPTNQQTVQLDAPKLPPTCPCPKDSYCDLATNTCVLGCLDDSYCASGKFCDMAAKLCKPGCRSAADCQDDTNVCTDLACNAGKCVFSPNAASCPDDGNACTADVCSAGSCTHPPAQDGKVCGSAADCTSKQCKAGACVDVFAAVGEACTDDADPCTDDACDGAGTCDHTVAADGTDCPDTWGPNWGAKCVKGKCTPLRYRCSGYSSMYYRLFSSKKVEKWTGTKSCGGCSGKTMKWSVVINVYPYNLNHTEYCALCIDKSGGGDECYDFP